MFRPSDLQLMLLHTAAMHADGNLILPPFSIGGQAVRIRQSVAPLVREGYLVERRLDVRHDAWRQDAEASYAAFITASGRLLVGDSTTSVPKTSETKKQRNHKPQSKLAAISLLLKRREGASLADLTDATGWQPHSARAALSKLKRRGITIRSRADAGTTRYLIAG